MIINLDNNKLEKTPPTIPIRERLSVFMQETGMTKTKVAELLGLSSYKNVNNILENKEEITLKSALGIAELLGVSLKDLIQSVKEDENDKSPLNVRAIKYASFLYSNFDINILRSVNLFKKGDSDEEMCSRLVKFFGYNTIYDFKIPESSKSALFSKKNVFSTLTAVEKRNKKMTNFWLTTAYQSFVMMDNPNQYDSELLIEFLSKRIQSYTKDETDGFRMVILILYQLGITVLVQDYLSHTSAFGVSMLVKGKPCIVLTALGGNYYKLWLTLLHELYHILHDWNTLEEFQCLISDEYQDNLFVSEEDANKFAYKCFVPEYLHNKLQLIIASKSKVVLVAEKLGVHPTMIYGVYLELIKDKNIQSKEFSRLSYFKNILHIKDTECLKDIIYNPIEEGTIKESVKKVKQSLGILTA